MIKIIFHFQLETNGYIYKISSSYTGKEYEKRLMVTKCKIHQKKIILFKLSKLYSDGSYYTYKINLKIKITDHQHILLLRWNG